MRVVTDPRPFHYRRTPSVGKSYRYHSLHSPFSLSVLLLLIHILFLILILILLVLLFLFSSYNPSFFFFASLCSVFSYSSFPILSFLLVILLLFPLLLFLLLFLVLLIILLYSFSFSSPFSFLLLLADLVF